MSYLPQRPALGAVSGTSLGLAALLAAGVAAVILWPRAKKSHRKGWLSYNSKHRRACDLSRRRPEKPPLSQITC